MVVFLAVAPGRQGTLPVFAVPPVARFTEIQQVQCWRQNCKGHDTSLAFEILHRFIAYMCSKQAHILDKKKGRQCQMCCGLNQQHSVCIAGSQKFFSLIWDFINMGKCCVRHALKQEKYTWICADIKYRYFLEDCHQWQQFRCKVNKKKDTYVTHWDGCWITKIPAELIRREIHKPEGSLSKDKLLQQTSLWGSTSKSFIFLYVRAFWGVDLTPFQQ